MDSSPASVHADHQIYVDGIRRGAADILNTIYEESFSEFVRRIMAAGVPEARAKDIFQEAVEVVITNFLTEEFALTCPFKAYLYSICRNKIKEFYRSKQRSSVRLSEAAHLTEEAEDLIGLAEEAERVSQWHALVRRTFGQLERRCQEIFNMVKEKIPAGQIAVKLEMTNANAVYQARFRCRDQWQRLMEDDPQYNACKPEGW